MVFLFKPSHGMMVHTAYPYIYTGRRKEQNMAAYLIMVLMSISE
jgi:hypothetical protein